VPGDFATFAAAIHAKIRVPDLSEPIVRFTHAARNAPVFASRISQREALVAGAMVSVGAILTFVADAFT
jgi:hypothetical protein